MNIAMILPSLAQTGPIIVAQKIVKYLISEGYKVDVYYFDDIVGVSFPCKTLKIGFNEKIQFDNYDIIHSHCFRPDKYLSKNKNDIHCKTITTIHCDIRKDLTSNYNIFISFVFRFIWLYYISNHNKIVVLNNYLKSSFYSHWIENEKITVIYNGCDRIVAKPISDEDKTRLKILSRNYKIIGANAGITYIKGFDQVVRALPYLKDYVLVIVGDGIYKDTLKSLSESLHVSDRIFFLGYRKNAISYLPFYDVYVQSSYQEGFPMALLEAGLAKKSCICSSIPVFKELYSEETVTFFELNNIASLILAIQRAYAERDQKGSNIYQLVLSQYSECNMGQKYVELYKE